MTDQYPPTRAPLLEITDLKTCFRTRDGLVTAVDGVSLAVSQGESLGVVGESGSGKSVTFASVMGLIKPPGWIAAGTLRFADLDLRGLSANEYRQVRGKDIAMTMQDAQTALNPAYTVGDQIIEVLLTHDPTLPRNRWQRRRQARAKAREMLDLVSIPSSSERLNEYPHQFSGGMRQRIMLAIALACRPKLLIADEPTTALDVTIQAQVLELIAEMRAVLGMSVVLITHDLGVVAEFCDRIAVMYAGQVVEIGPVTQVIQHPAHPYTKGLLDSIPRLDQPRRPIRPIPGHVPQLIDIPKRCRFMDRCALAHAACQQPVAMHGRERGHEFRCIRAPAPTPS